MQFIRNKFKSKERIFQRSKDHIKKTDQSLSQKSLLMKGKVIGLYKSNSKGLTFSKSKLQINSKDPSVSKKKFPVLRKSTQDYQAKNPRENSDTKFRLKKPFIRKSSLDKKVPEKKTEPILKIDQILEQKLIEKLHEEPEFKTCYLNILESWGDQRYVGLNGLEFFNTNGEKIQP